MQPTFDLAKPDLSAWRAGNTGVEGVWSLPADASGRHVLITALVHGNELCGAWALRGLLESGLRSRRGRLTLAFCNLDAFDRFDPRDADGSRFVEEDLNRQWSPERMARGASLEARRAQALLPWVSGADWLLDLHSMHEASPPLSLTGLVPGNVALARAMGAPTHIVMDAGHAEGVRLRDYGQFLAPSTVDGPRSLLVECGWHGDPSSERVARDQCLRFLRHSGIFDSAELDRRLAGWALPDAPHQELLEVTGAVVARSSDFRFSQPFSGLEVIARAGTRIGSNAGTPVRTPHDHCVLVMPSTRQARAGVTVVRFARHVPLVADVLAGATLFPLQATLAG